MINRRWKLVLGAGATAATLVLPLAGPLSANDGSRGGGRNGGTAAIGAPGPNRPGRWGFWPPFVAVPVRSGPGWGTDAGKRHDPGKDGNKPTTSTTSTSTPSTPERLAALQRRCVAAIDARLVQLRGLSGAITKAPNLTTGHQASLSDILSSSTSGITALKATIQADTDLATLQGHCQDIVTGFRIYALVTPQVHLVIAADEVSAAADRLGQVADRIDQAIAAAKAAGTDTTQAEADLANMKSELAAGQSAASGIAAKVLGLTPADYNADPTVLASSRAALASARGHLWNAAKDGAQAVKALGTT